MKILFEGPQWFVLEKPCGIHSVRGDDTEAKSVEDWVRENIKSNQDLPEGGVVHRLDQKTSGCLLVAKNLEAYTALRERMSSNDGNIQKIYLAIVEGNIKPGKFVLYYHSRYKRSQKITVSKIGANEIRGECQWSVRETREHSTLLEVNLIGRGKRHQIRAGFAHLGHPIRGDTLYGGKLWREGFGLHAYKLVIDGQKVTCLPPENWYVGKSQREPGENFREIDFEG